MERVLGVSLPRITKTKYLGDEAVIALNSSTEDSNVGTNVQKIGACANLPSHFLGNAIDVFPKSERNQYILFSLWRTEY